MHVKWKRTLILFCVVGCSTKKRSTDTYQTSDFSHFRRTWKRTAIPLILLSLYQKGRGTDTILLMYIAVFRSLYGSDKRLNLVVSWLGWAFDLSEYLSPSWRRTAVCSFHQKKGAGHEPSGLHAVLFKSGDSEQTVSLNNFSWRELLNHPTKVLAMRGKLHY